MVRAPDLDAHPARPADVAARFLAFATALAAGHHLPALVGEGATAWVDLPTPFLVLGAAAWALSALRPGPRLWALFGAAAILYVDGHGIHLSANAIRAEGTTGGAEDVAHFWDETWGHLEWHAGLFLLLAALCLADARQGSPLPLAAGSLLLGFTVFSNTVEGGDWWLALAAAAAFVPWAAVSRSPLRLAVGGAFALFALLLAVWAVWQGGVPQFSELGWI